MRALATLPLSLCFLLPLSSNAQHSAIGIKGAALLSDTRSGAVQNELIPNASAGFYFALRAGDRLEVQPEVLATSLGTSYSLPDGERATLRLIYLQLPVSAKFYFNNVVNIQAGFQAGRLMLAQQSGPEGSEDVTGSYQTWDYGLVFGAGADLVRGIDFGLRYYNGMSAIRLDESERYPRNRAFMLSVGYRLGRIKAPSFNRRRG